MTSNIASALDSLVGLPFRGTTRAADLQMFSFGDLVSKKTKKGETMVGSIALHVQCPWRLTKSNKILTGSADIYIPANGSYELPADFDWDVAGANRCDFVLSSLLRHEGVHVDRVRPDRFGGFTLKFSDGHVLTVFPDIGFGSQDREAWRLARLGERHFVVMAGAAEWV
jgi:hypothetical protein